MYPLTGFYPTSTLIGFDPFASSNSNTNIDPFSSFATIDPFVSSFLVPNSFNSFPQQQSSNGSDSIFMSLIMALLNQGQNQQTGTNSNNGNILQQLLSALTGNIGTTVSDQIINSADLGNNGTTVTDTVVPDTNTTTIADDAQGVWGDPHYTATGADGKTPISFIHKGQVGNTYNVFSGNGLEVDSFYGADGPKGALQTETQIHDGNDIIDYKIDGSLTVNGKPVEPGTTVTLGDGTKITAKGQGATITKNGGTIDLSNTDGIIVDPSGNFNNLSGILGTAIGNNTNLTEDQANKFDITTTNKAIKP